MNNDTGENSERRGSHSVTLQWCSRDQSMTTTLTLPLRLSSRATELLCYRFDLQKAI